MDASTRLNGGSSLHLETEQRKAEDRHFFEATLALAQIYIRNVAGGYPSGNIPDQVGYMTPASKPICSMYKFRSTCWRNISVSGFIGAVAAGTVTILLSITSEDEHLLIEKLIGKFRQSILFDILVKGRKNFISGFGKSYHLLQDGIKLLCKHIGRGCVYLSVYFRKVASG